MAAEFFGTGTDWVFAELTLTRGSVSDIESVGVHMDADPNARPTVAEFSPATLVDGTATYPGPLAISGRVDIAVRVGARSDVPAALQLSPGDYQMFTCVTTADEDDIRIAGTVTVK
jgi:hypothetical protein